MYNTASHTHLNTLLLKWAYITHAVSCDRGEITELYFSVVFISGPLSSPPLAHVISIPDPDPPLSTGQEPIVFNRAAQRAPTLRVRGRPPTIYLGADDKQAGGRSGSLTVLWQPLRLYER